MEYENLSFEVSVQSTINNNVCVCVCVCVVGDSKDEESYATVTRFRISKKTSGVR